MLVINGRGSLTNPSCVPVRIPPPFLLRASSFQSHSKHLTDPLHFEIKIHSMFLLRGSSAV